MNTSMVLFARSTLIAFSFLAVWALPVHAQEPTGPKYAYVSLEPDIVTNFAGDNAKRLGYVRMAVEIMVMDLANIQHVEHHLPLLRATAIEIIGAQPEEKIKSLTGREELRRTLLQRFKDIMMRESGKEVVKNIIFTKFLYQGG